MKTIERVLEEIDAQRVLEEIDAQIDAARKEVEELVSGDILLIKYRKAIVEMLEISFRLKAETFVDGSFQFDGGEDNSS